ncbi:hypothetical protein KKB40_06560, partial [Patescibacteria group bacterium]|nr:hypothetical protein [Patescibacteria group bacterium]
SAHISELVTSLLSEELAHERGAEGDIATEQALAQGCADNTMTSLDADQFEQYIAFIGRYGRGLDEGDGYLRYLKQQIIDEEKVHGIPQSLSQKIDLSILIGLLKELSNKGYGNQYYYELIADTERLGRMVKEFKGKPERLDTLVNLQASYRNQAAVELIANAIDAVMAENGIVAIGRFGVGAFQSLAELEDEGDSVTWTTSKDGKTGLRIVITKGKDEGQYYYQSQIVIQGVRKGTSTKVYKKQYSREEQKALIEYIKSKLYLNYRCPIYVNGILINPIEETLFINGDRLNYLTSAPVLINVGEHGYSVDDPGIGMDFQDVHRKLLIARRGKDLPSAELTDEEIFQQVKVFYAPHERMTPVNERVKSSIHIQVAGIIIESFETEGYVLPKDLVIEFPANTMLTEDRQHIQLTPQTIKAIEAAIEKVLSRSIQNQVKIINGIAHMLECLSQRDERALGILQFMNNLIRDWRKEKQRISGNRFVYLPNEEAFFHVAIPEDKEAVYINGTVLPFNPEGFPGAARVDSWRSVGYALWALPFIASSDKISFEFSHLIIVSSDHYNHHRNNPAPLDLEINPIATTYEPKGFEVRPKGRLLPAKITAEREEAKPKRETRKGMPEIVKRELDALTGLNAGVLQGLTVRITRFFRISNPDKKKTEEIAIWLRRLGRFDGLLFSENQALNMVVGALKFELELPSGKDYSRIESKRKLENLNLDKPYHSILLPDGNLAVTNYGDDSLSIIDPITWTEVRKITNIGLDWPRGIVLLQDGNFAVTNYGDNSLSIIDPITGTEVRKITNI